MQVGGPPRHSSAIPILEVARLFRCKLKSPRLGKVALLKFSAGLAAGGDERWLARWAGRAAGPLIPLGLECASPAAHARMGLRQVPGAALFPDELRQGVQKEGYGEDCAREEDGGRHVSLPSRSLVSRLGRDAKEVISEA